MIKNATFILLLILLSIGCGQAYEGIPEVDVSISIDVTSSTYSDLSYVGGYAYLTGGYKGILVYRHSLEEFVAFERTCPYDPSVTTARIEVEESGLILVDSTCGSRFLIIDGSVYEGPCTRSLKQYSTAFDGIYLRIWN